MLTPSQIRKAIFELNKVAGTASIQRPVEQQLLRDLPPIFTIVTRTYYNEPRYKTLNNNHRLRYDKCTQVVIDSLETDGTLFCKMREGWRYTSDAGRIAKEISARTGEDILPAHVREAQRRLSICHEPNTP